MSLTRLNRLKTSAARLSAQLDRAKERATEETEAFERAVVKYGHESQAQTIVQAVAQSVQQQAHDRIASVVSHCLSAVFAEPLKFVVRFDRKRGKTEAVLTFLKGKEEVSPAFGSAGGELDVASFALRLACMSLTQPALRKVLILDEPARAIHGEGNRERFRELIETLPRELGVQVIFVTGLDWLQCGKVVKL
jgi:ABC-type sugar transport system ATPase subunit